MREAEGIEVGVEVRIGGGEKEGVGAVVGDIAGIVGVIGIVGVRVAGKAEIDSLEHQSEEGPDPYSVDKR
jgi:hypothetical protein